MKDLGAPSRIEDGRENRADTDSSLLKACLVALD